MKRRKSFTKRDKAIIYKELKNFIEESKIKTDENVLVTYAFDSSPTPFSKPSFVILPKNRDEVVHTLIIANKYNMPVTVMSGGINVSGHCVPSENGIILDLRGMDKVLEINTDSNYAVIEPGVIFDRFTAALREKGYRCQIPTAPGGATPLGNYLLKPSGNLSTRHLDSILDLEIVTPDGTVVNTGSSQFPGVGNFLRYGPLPDLTGLFCCAYGTLGIVTKASVRIYPINESIKINISAFENYKASVDFVKDIINHNVCEHCIIWSWEHYRSYEITFPEEMKLHSNPTEPPENIPYNIVTTFISGYEEMTSLNEEICGKVTKKYGGRVLSEKEIESLLPTARYSWMEFYKDYRQPRMEGAKKFGMGRYLAWIVHAEPKDIVNLEQWALRKLYDIGLNPICYYSMPFDFGRCMFFRLFTYIKPENKELLNKAQTTFREMYDTAINRYKAIPLRYRYGANWLNSVGKYYDLLRKIKKAIDPKNILNPNLKLFGEDENENSK